MKYKDKHSSCNSSESSKSVKFFITFLKTFGFTRNRNVIPLIQSKQHKGSK